MIDRDPLDYLAERFDRSDHWPKRSCLGCGGSSPFGYVFCEGRGVRLDVADGALFTWNRIGRQIDQRHLGQMRLGL